MTSPKVVTDRTDFLNPPTKFLLKPTGLTIFSVEAIDTVKPANVAPLTVTNFTKGYPGQTIHILGDGQTTIANNANIKTSTGANKLLTANKVYNFTLIEGIWYEDG